jgi:hypothetical protein
MSEFPDGSDRSGPPLAPTEPPFGSAVEPEAAAPSAAVVATPGSGIEALGDLLESVALRPLPEHAEVYEQVHTQLQSALAQIDGA